MYKHDATTGTFEEFQVVPTNDVGSPATLYVGTSLYLLLLSEEERLDVYCYIPLEVRGGGTQRRGCVKERIVRKAERKERTVEERGREGKKEGWLCEG